MSTDEEEVTHDSGHGWNPHRITRDNDETVLVVNQPLQPPTASVLSGAETGSIMDITSDQPRMPYRYHVWRSVKQKRQHSDWLFCGHLIDAEAVTDKTHENTPRYLYRAFSDESAGVNDPDHLQSEAVKQSSPVEMSALKECEVSEPTLWHLRKKKFPSPWISMTPSPEWAFDRALRLKAEGKTNIHLAIIDTLDLKQPALIFHTPALLKAYDLEKHMPPIKNRGRAEKMVWNELITPGAVIPLDHFLKTCRFLGDRLVPQYSAMQPMHHKPLESIDQSISEVLKVLERNPTRGLYAPCKIKARYKNGAEIEHQIEVRKSQGERTWRMEHTAGRLFRGKKLNNKLEENKRMPISDFIMDHYLNLVEQNFPPKFQFPMLIALLSARLDHFEYDSIVEALGKLSDGQRYKCHIRNVSTPSLPELDAFEDLLRGCAEECGLEVEYLSKDRKFLTLDAQYTKMPTFHPESIDLVRDTLERVKWANKREEEKAMMAEEAREKQRKQELYAEQAELRKAQRSAILSKKRKWDFDELMDSKRACLSDQD